jgi:hypothetical protein
VGYSEHRINTQKGIADANYRTQLIHPKAARAVSFYANTPGLPLIEKTPAEK